MKRRNILMISTLLIVLFVLSSCITINLRFTNGSIDATKKMEETSADIIMETTKAAAVPKETKAEIKKENVKIYKGEAQGYNDKIDVEVSLDGLVIKDIVVTSHKETPGIGGELKDKFGEVMTIGGESPITLIPRLMVENQSINVDAVTGATVTSFGIAHAVVDAMVKADIRVDAMTSPTEDLSKHDNTSSEDAYMPPTYELSEEEKNLYAPYFNKVNFATRSFVDITDVIIVGGGGAGLNAALAALHSYKEVVVLERNGEVGGDTLVCGAIYNAPDRELQKKLGKMSDEKYEVIEKALNETPINDEHKKLQDIVREELEEFKKLDNEENGAGVFDSENWFALQTWNAGDKVADLNLVKELCKFADEGLEVLKFYGMEFYDFVSQGAGALWERTHTSKMPMGTGLISTLLSGISDYQNNINIYTHVEATSLIQNENKEVVGVRCRDVKNGMEFEIRCERGVVLATGGFSANTELINEYNEKWPDLTNVRTTNRKTSSNGSGILMAREIGADTVDMKEIQLLYLGNTVNGQLTRYPKRDVNATDQIIFINEEGKRFTNEGGRRDDISKSILNLKRNYFYILESGDGKDYVDIYGSDYTSADGFSFDYLKDNGYIIVADTLEELAEKLDMDVNILKSTIEDFNKCVDGEKEDEFGRTLYSTKFTKGPYVATPREVSIHHTMGGLKINEQCEVLDKNGNVIKGLYAAGEVTGGIHGANRVGGNAVVDITVFGKGAGNVVGYEPDDISG